MAKMTTKERHLYTRYFYNSAIEFIYFIILYLETYGTASLCNINKYVKFFKAEVTDLISLFRGTTPVDKLVQMLQTLDCFIIFENEIRFSKIINWKDVIFEDLVISKCVDLLLRRQSNMDDICKNLNLNSVVTVSQNDLLHVIEKYSYISICSDKTVTLHHFHGLMGFEDYICKSVICYFHDILHHSYNLSYEEVRNHSISLSFCGLNNMIEILSILHCSDQFICKEGYVFLKKRSEKCLKQKPIHMEEIKSDFSARSMHVGKIVHDMYGSFLHQWTGEIGTIKKNYGVIYCVVDFTNGHQGVFKVIFSKAVLKVISELYDLKYLNVRDAVEFDAQYYDNKMSDRCWKATRVKLCNDRFQYDEVVSDKMSHDSELKRIKCLNNKCCLKINPQVNELLTDSLNIKNKKRNKKHLGGKKFKTSDYESCSSSVSNIGLEIDSHSNHNVPHKQELLTNLCFDASNEHILDYFFMFGYVHLLMEDKGIAIANYGNKCYNILFMIDSIYTPNKSDNFFLTGQKILAVIPYIQNFENIESVCISPLVYGLNEKETNETESINMSPKEFAIKTLFSNLSSLCIGCHNYYNSFDGLPKKCLVSGLSYKIQLSKLYDFIKTQYRLTFTNDKVFLLLLHNICKTNLKDENFDRKVFQYFMKLAKCFSNHADRMKAKRKNKRKRMIQDTGYRFNEPEEILQQDFSIKTSKKRFCSESDVPNLNSNLGKKLNSENGTSDLCLRIKPNLLNGSYSDQSSFGSFKTCTTSCSEVFYSCELEFNSPKKFSYSFFDNDASDILNFEGSPFKMKSMPEIKMAKPLPTIFNDKCKILAMNSCQYLKMKVQKNYKNISDFKGLNYLSLQLVPSFKCSFKKQKRNVPSCSFKSACANCVRSSLVLKARVSLISKSFFFFSTTIDGHYIVLPFPKKSMSSSLLENIKLNSSAEIIVIPSAILNLSHILKFRIFI